MHRPFEFLLLSVFTEMWEKSQKFHFSISMIRYVESRPSSHFSIIFLSIKHDFSKIRGGDFFDLFIAQYRKFPKKTVHGAEFEKLGTFL